jgi:hypothetical protein
MATRPAPLVVRWHALDLANVEAGAVQIATVEVENAGAARWRTRGPLDGLFLSYHWLDERGNPLFWDGIRTPLAHPVEPGEIVRHPLRLRGPIPPGRYRLSVDLVEESRFWLEDLGNAPLQRDVEVLPREASGARAFLPDGAEPAPGWEALVKAAHAAGYAAVGGAIDLPSRLRRSNPDLEPYAPGGGRNPSFAFPLICPSLLPPLEPNAEVGGLPAWRNDGPDGEPWLYDARAVVTLRSRSGRRRD